MKKRKKPITLIEIMIVILLIGLISGALAFNMRGSLDQGKIFKTEQAQMRVHDILSLAIAQGTISLDQVKTEWKTILARSPLVPKGVDLTKDGWNKPFTVRVDQDEIIVESSTLIQYRQQHGQT